MDILIIASLIIGAVILFLVELFVIPGISVAGFLAEVASSLPTTMPLSIWAPRQVSLRLSYLPWLVSARWYGSCAPRHSTKLH